MSTATRTATQEQGLTGLEIEVAQECALDRFTELDAEQICHLAINGSTEQIKSRAAELLMTLFENRSNDRFGLSQIICQLLDSEPGEDYAKKAFDLFKVAEPARNGDCTAIAWAKFLKVLRGANEELLNQAFDHVFNGKLITSIEWFEVAKKHLRSTVVEKATRNMFGDCFKDNSRAEPTVNEILELPWSKFCPETQGLLLKYFQGVQNPEKKYLNRAAKAVSDEPTKKQLFKMVFQQTDIWSLASLLGLPMRVPHVPEPGEKLLK